MNGMKLTCLLSSMWEGPVLLPPGRCSSDQTTESALPLIMDFATTRTMINTFLLSTNDPAFEIVL